MGTAAAIPARISSRTEPHSESRTSDRPRRSFLFVGVQRLTERQRSPRRPSNVTLTPRPARPLSPGACRRRAQGSDRLRRPTEGRSAGRHPATGLSRGRSARQPCNPPGSNILRSQFMASLCQDRPATTSRRRGSEQMEHQVGQKVRNKDDDHDQSNQPRHAPSRASAPGIRLGSPPLEILIVAR